MSQFQDKEEKKNKRIGIAVSLGVHALLLLIFAFLLAWKEPNPPIPEYGIELNFGLDAEGAGDVQPEVITEETSSPGTEEAEETVEEEVLEETEPVEAEEADESTPAEVQEDAASEPDEVVVDKVESPDVRTKEPATVADVKPIKEEKPREVVKKETPVEKKPAEPVKKEPTEKPADKPAGGVSSDKVVESKSQGDNSTPAGDKGKEEGTVDARALYGTPGGGGGASLDLAGWAWEEVPRPRDTSNESGRLVFEITVDDNGEVIGIKTLERGVSASIESIYREEVANLYFKRNPPDSPAPPRSVGKITFIIKSR